MRLFDENVVDVAIGDDGQDVAIGDGHDELDEALAADNDVNLSLIFRV
jgi:hypothetical protein